MDIAIAGAGTWLRLDAAGAIAEARIVLVVLTARALADCCRQLDVEAARP
jgi:hypothetical protein